MRSVVKCEMVQLFIDLITRQHRNLAHSVGLRTKSLVTTIWHVI